MNRLTGDGDHVEKKDSDKKECDVGDAFFMSAFAIQGALVCFYLFNCQYGKFMNDTQYIFYKDVTVMMLIGFGYLMTFLRRYGLGAVGVTFLLTVIILQIVAVGCPLFDHMLEGKTELIDVDVNSLVLGQFGVAAVLISFGGLIGKVTPTQMLILATIEAIAYCFNRQVLLLSWLQTSDMGGTIFIHLFGAYFGLAAAYQFGIPTSNEGSWDEPSRISDIFSMIGTIFLWIYWPSFNGATAPQGELQQLRTTVNTVMALCGSTSAAFIFSRFFGGKRQFRPVDIQNATLAGGVAIGASSNLLVGPGGAICVGLAAGFVSTYGYNFIQGPLEAKGLHDSCGIHNLHGMPALLGCAVSTLMSYIAIPKEYGEQYDIMFPRGAAQAQAQIAGTVVCLGFAIISGTIAAFFVKKLVPRSDSRVSEYNFAEFRDDMHWEESAIPL